MVSRESAIALQRRHGILHKQVFDALAESLMCGEFKPGDQLTIRQLATRLGTSTMPVREAVRRLAALGAVLVHPQKYLSIPEISLDSFLEVAEMRKLLEARAIYFACKKMTEDDLRVASGIHAQLFAAGRSAAPSRLMRMNQQFHFCLYRFARSELLLEAITHLWLRAGPHMSHLLGQQFAHDREHQPLAYFREHDTLMKALVRRDSKSAVASIVADIDCGKEIFIESVQASHRAPLANALVARQ